MAEPHFTRTNTETQLGKKSNFRKNPADCWGNYQSDINGTAAVLYDIMECVNFQCKQCSDQER